MSDKNPANRTAVITGASQGIGRAIAMRLAADGCDCFLLSRSADKLASVSDEITAAGSSAYWHAADLSTVEGCATAADAVRARFDGVDILVNCAGDARGGAFVSQPDEDWLSGFALKFHGAVRVTRALWPSLSERKGTVINIGGAAVYTPSNTFMVGGAVNAALAHFTKSLSNQGLIDDVNVNIVHPGMTVSERMERLLQQQAEAAEISVEEAMQKSVEASGTRRLGQLEDIANTVAFLCNPASRHIQGVEITVDGGATKGFH